MHVEITQRKVAPARRLAPVLSCMAVRRLAKSRLLLASVFMALGSRPRTPRIRNEASQPTELRFGAVILVPSPSASQRACFVRGQGAKR